MNGTTVKYNGTIPSYNIDGKAVDTSKTPGIINDRGIAMCNAAVVFKAAGVKVSYKSSKKTITFKYNDNKLVLYLNSDRAVLNDEEVKSDSLCASYRVKYSDSGKTVTYVPSRFVAESLGMDYTWDSSKKTAFIKTPVKLGMNDEIVYYLGSLGNISIDGEKCENSSYPSIIISDNAMLSTDSVFEDLDNTDFLYQKKTGDITIRRGDITLKMKVGTTITYVNGVIGSCPVAPVRIRNYETGTVGLYVPGRYVFETLGYDYSWNESKKESQIAFVEGKTGVFSPGYVIGAICDAPQGLTLPDDEDPDYYQEFGFPFPDDITFDDIIYEDAFYENTVKIEIEGDHTEFYKDNLENTGEAVLQANVLYYPEEDVTRINIALRTDENNIIIGHRDEIIDDMIWFTFDLPKNLYDKIIILDAGHGGKDTGTRHGGYNEKDMNFAIIYKYCKQYFDQTDIKVYYSRYDDTLPTLYQRAWLGARVGADFFISVHHNSHSNTKAKGTSVYYSTEDVGTFPARDDDDGEEYEELVENESGETSENTGIDEVPSDGNTVENNPSDENTAENSSDNTVDDIEDEEDDDVLTGKIMAQMLLDALVESLGTENRGIIDRNFVVVGKNNSVPAVLIEVGFMSNPDELKRIITKKFQKKVAKTIYKTVLEMYEIYGD
ncbi:MAG: N-acetylmuramoyl-L-alanine amidase [Lachnospiraceae bacterium]|nr:N-acetylmuramoyl-L-alanine amidase [Lachnospiraceae bacterium]